jgi:hypothetical protein
MNNGNYSICNGDFKLEKYCADTKLSEILTIHKLGYVFGCHSNSEQFSGFRFTNFKTLSLTSTFPINKSVEDKSVIDSRPW